MTSLRLLGAALVALLILVASLCYERRAWQCPRPRRQCRGVLGALVPTGSGGLSEPDGSFAPGSKSADSSWDTTLSLETVTPHRRSIMQGRDWHRTPKSERTRWCTAGRAGNRPLDV